ncbi:DEAD/DEAH box helicase [Fusarium oxysporum f. sp. phaseoli]
MQLRQLYPDSKSAAGHAPPTGIDIIAVHGLGPPAKGETKHAFDTWRTPSGQKGCLWLQKDLPKYLPDSRIFLYQYDTTRGLLIKQALISTYNNPNYSTIKNATTNITFFGTQHASTTEELSKIAAAITKDLGHETGFHVVESLQAGSIFSELESWKHQALQYDIVSFWGSSDTMVSRKSVSLGLPGYVAKVVELDASHRGLCKFGNTDKDQYNLKIVVENIKRLYEVAMEKSESQDGWFPDTSGVETPCTSEGYDRDELDACVKERQTATTSTTDTISIGVQPVFTPSQDSQLQADETTVQNSLIRDFGHPTAEEAPSLAGPAVEDFHIAEIQVIEPEAQGNLYSRTPFTELCLLEPILRSLVSWDYSRPTKVQEALISVFASYPPRIVVTEYPPGTGRTTALVIAILLRIDNNSTTQPQVLVIVPNLLLVDQMESRTKEIGMHCDGLVVQAVPLKVEKDARFEANVIISTPGTLLNNIKSRRITTSGVRLLVVDNVDYVRYLQGLGEQSARVARRLPKTGQFLLSSDSSTGASEFLISSKPEEKLELKAEELNTNNIVHLFFRCETEKEKLDVICNLPGVVQIGMLIIFVEMGSSAQEIEKKMAKEGHAVANLFDAENSEHMEALLKMFKEGNAKVLITEDRKTRGLDLPSSSMVINYDIPDADSYRYIRQASRAGKAGRSGFAVNLVSDETELDALRSVAASGCFNLHELDSNDWDAAEQFLRNCTRSQRF